jgi:hypothetical protein
VNSAATPRSSAEIHDLVEFLFVVSAACSFGQRVRIGVRPSQEGGQRLRFKFFVQSVFKSSLAFLANVLAAEEQVFASLATLAASLAAKSAVFAKFSILDTDSVSFPS